MASPSNRVWQSLRNGKRPYMLALQGGGTFGAFQAAVLCTLLADPTFPLPTHISGTSAGALNAVVLADALLAGGNETARRARAIAALKALWHDRIPKMAVEYINKYFPEVWKMPAPTNAVLDLMQHALSMWLETLQLYGMSAAVPRIREQDNPLKMLLSKINFARIRKNRRIKLYIATCEADAPHTGRIFTTTEITREVIAASGALPDMFEPITIDGKRYIEGGYAHNPPLMQPIAEGVRTVVLIRLNSDNFRPPRYRGEQVFYDQAETFNRPLNRDKAAIAAHNVNKPSQTVTVFDIGGLARSGFTPPQKRQVSHRLIAQLFEVGYRIGRTALSKTPDTF